MRPANSRKASELCSKTQEDTEGNQGNLLLRASIVPLMTQTGRVVTDYAAKNDRVAADAKSSV